MEITKQTQDDFVAAIKSTLNEHAFIRKCMHESFIHHFKGYGGCASFCRVHLFTSGELTIVVFEDLGDDTGTSITNASEQLANEIVRLRHLNPDKTSWLECYPRYTKDFDIDVISYNYDQVANLYSNPQWSRWNVPGKERTIMIDYIRKRIAR